MAYLSRKGFTVDGTDSVKPMLDATHIKYANHANDNVKYADDVSTNVKYDTNVKPDVKYANNAKTLSPAVKPEPMDIARLLESLSER